MAATKKRANTKKRGQDKIEQADMGSVSALDLLEQDHREVEGFFDEYEKLEDVDEKERIALKICLALTVHNFPGMPGLHSSRPRQTIQPIAHSQAVCLAADVKVASHRGNP